MEKEHPKVKFAEWYFEDHKNFYGKIELTRQQFFNFLAQYECQTELK